MVDIKTKWFFFLADVLKDISCSCFSKQGCSWYRSRAPCWRSSRRSRKKKVQNKGNIWCKQHWMIVECNLTHTQNPSPWLQQQPGQRCQSGRSSLWKGLWSCCDSSEKQRKRFLSCYEGRFGWEFSILRVYWWETYFSINFQISRTHVWEQLVSKSKYASFATALKLKARDDTD